MLPAGSRRAVGVAGCRLAGAAAVAAARGLSSSAAGGSAGTEAGPDLAGKTYCVTGSTDGIGRNTALLLAKHNATVLIHGRDTSSVRREIQALRKASGNRRVYGYAYDLSSLEQVRAFAAHVRHDVELYFGGELDCLVNNAGCFHAYTRVTEEGLGELWAVNIAAPFLLTGSLRDVVAGRILNVSSISMAARLDFDVVKQGFHLGGYNAYCASKLALCMWTYRLARLLADRSHSCVTANVLDPGTVNTKLLFSAFGAAADQAMRVEDARDEFWAATDPGLARTSGKYFVSRKPRDSPPFSYDKPAQQQLWLALERQTGIVY